MKPLDLRFGVERPDTQGMARLTRRRWLLCAIMACGLPATGVLLFICPRRPEVSAVPDFGAALAARKAASTRLVLFIPSKDRQGTPIDQEFWVGEALQVLGRSFGGATAFPRGRGVWRDDAQAGALLHDEPVIIQCYTSAAVLEQQAPALRDFLHRLGRGARQGAVGLVIDRDYLEIGFPLEKPPVRPGQRKKRR